MNKTSCVYAITCTKNNKVYVGSTNNFHRRQLEHLQSLKRHTHENSNLQEDYDLYGKEHFVFNIVEELDGYIVKSDRFNRENYWIQKLDTRNVSLGYNISDAFGSKPMSDKQKKQVSKVHKGKQFSQEQRELFSDLFSGNKNPKAKPVYQYDNNGIFIRKFSYLREVTMIFPELKYGVIGDRCCLKNSNGKFVNERLIYKGYLWSYSEPIEGKIPPIESEPYYQQ